MSLVTTIDSLFFDFLIRPPAGAREFEAKALNSALLAGGISVATGVGTSLLLYKKLTVTGTLLGAAIPITTLAGYAYWRFPGLRGGF